MLSFDEAPEKLLAGAKPVSETKAMPTIAAAGRVLAEAQYSTLSVPPLDNFGDGRLRGPRGRYRRRRHLAAGVAAYPGRHGRRYLQPGTAARIFTGAPIPAGADAVVMQERCEHAGENVVFNHVPKAGEHIRRAGEDVAPNAQILAAGARLRPQDTAFAASVGLATLPVLRRVRVAVFFTGDELRMPGEPLPPGAIYNSNRFALVALLERLGCEVRDLGLVPDRLEPTRAALRAAAADNDLIITSGGVSVGEEDHIKPAVEAEGRLDMWKIGIKPGKPLAAFGAVTSGDKECAFIGLPGNPVSAFVTFLTLVRPFVLRLSGVDKVRPKSYLLRADYEWARPMRGASSCAR